MATITATKAGDFSDPTVWDLERMPAVGDTIDLATYAVVYDAGSRGGLLAGDLITGKTILGIVGSRVDATVTSVLDSHSYGDPGAQKTGTYHAPAAAEVIDSARFGAASVTPGTYHAPAASEVWHTAVFGAASATPGTKVASSIANCIPANIRIGVVIDDVTGDDSAADYGLAAEDLRYGKTVGDVTGTLENWAAYHGAGNYRK